MNEIFRMEMNNLKNNKLIILNKDKNIIYIVNGEKKQIFVDKKVLDNILYYMKYLSKVPKTGWDRYTKIIYDGIEYNKGLAFYDIEKMITQNKCIEEILKNEPLTIYQEKVKREKETKELEIKKRREEWLLREQNSPQIHLSNLTESKENKRINSIKFELGYDDIFKNGETVVLPDYIDIADDVDYPKDMRLLAQIKLSDLCEYDIENKLPKKGYLYFFQAPMVDNYVYTFGKVIYSENENVKRIELNLPDDGLEVNLYVSKINIINESLDDYTEYDLFPKKENSETEEVNKIFGVYCTYMSNKEICNKVTNNYEILLRIGSILYGEGVTTFLIKPEDLKNLNFDNVIFDYNQT